MVTNIIELMGLHTTGKEMTFYSKYSTVGTD